MEKTFIKSVLYFKHEEEKVLKSPTNKLLQIVYDNKNIEFLIQNVSKDGKSIFMSFANTELAKVKNEIKDEEVLKILENYEKKIANHCTVCGSINSNYLPYTYREHYGTVGRSYECMDCRNLDNESTVKIAETRRESGHIKAVEYIEDIYNSKLKENKGDEKSE